MNCWKCGKENSDYNVYCRTCGACLQEKNPENSIKKSEGERKRTIRIIVYGVALIIIVSGVVGILMFQKMKERKMQEYIAVADQYFIETEYQKAEENYLKAIEIDSKHEQLYLKLSDALIKQGKQKQAILLIEQGELVTGESDKLTQKKEELRSWEPLEGEGYFSYNSEEISVSISVLDGATDRKTISLFYTERQKKNGDTIYFQWQADTEQYQQVQGKTKENYKIAVEEKERSLLVSLSDTEKEEPIFENIELEKQNFFNQANVILAIEEYVKSGESDLLKEGDIKLSVNGVENSMYAEHFLVSVYDVNQETEEDSIYIIVVASRAMKASGEAAIYSKADFEQIMDNSENFGTVESEEEFNINDYFTFE